MKPRRDITLGEMQDECKRRNGSCFKDQIWCSYNAVCPAVEISESEHKPCDIDLTDPPRFNEQQMALLRAMFGMGAVRVRKLGRNVFFFLKTEGASIAWIAEDKFGESGLDDEKSLDLAELLGKDGESK